MAADLSQLLLPLLVIVGGAAAFRALFHRAGQPEVLGEMVLGILLGATLLGWVWPQGQAALFPAEAMGTLQAIGWIGLALFMFYVGTEMHWRRGDGRTTARLAYGALVLPFTLGLLLAIGQPGWFFAGPPTLQHVVLVAVILCVSALPVLARILEHHGLLHQRLGTIILGAGTIADLFAWGVLAFAVGTAGVGLTGHFGLNFAVVAVLFAGAFLVDRALSRVLAARPIVRGNGTLALLVCAILGSAWLTQAAGLHALLGPLIVGALVSRHPELQEFARPKLQGLTMVLFLPTFFVVTGLGTDLTLIASSTGALAFVVVLLVATLGKVVGSWIGGHAAGLAPRERVTAGLLLNARGAVDLVVAKIGLDAGLLTPAGFALLVLVIVVTTFAAGPLLTAYLRWDDRRAAPATPAAPSRAMLQPIPDALRLIRSRASAPLMPPPLRGAVLPLRQRSEPAAPPPRAARPRGVAAAADEGREREPQ